ncbi:MAG: D-alanyl-D-alanine carboxypeptidase family protein [Pseudomonadota bacterium]|nr:D-alanyl-D-alanine carboxypeptidase family protein [Pseudomonadota bacterium]
MSLLPLRLTLPTLIMLWATLATGFSSPASAIPAPVPAPPPVAGNSHVLIDHHSGRVLAENQPDLRVEPASITKLMTSYVVFHALASGELKLDDPVRISEKAWRMPGSRSFVEVGKSVPAEVLLKGMIVQSGNDASVALAEHLAGTETAFATLMNHHAELLGLTNTHFMNATGLPDPDHYTTARDVAALSRALINEFPEYYAWYAVKKFSYNGIDQYNRNRLLWRDETVDGLKTGHTEAAGYCLAATALRDDMRLISVVMGTDNENARESASQALLNYGFRFFQTYRLYGAGEGLTTAPVWKADRDTVAVGIEEPLYVTIPRGQYESLEATITLNELITAPIGLEQSVGTARVMLHEELLAERPLYPLEPVPEGGLWRRLRDEVLLLWQ